MRLILSVVFLGSAVARADAPADVIRFNAALYETVHQAAARCPGVRVTQHGLEFLREMYDPGSERGLFDVAATATRKAWLMADGRALARLCSEAMREWGPRSPHGGGKWLSR